MNKPKYDVQVQNRPDAVRIMQLLRPWLGERRREQVDAVLNALPKSGEQ
jgi:hypothetical protein